MLGSALAETAAFPAERREECHVHLLLARWSAVFHGWLGWDPARLGRSDPERTAKPSLCPTSSQLNWGQGFPPRHPPTRHGRFGPLYSPLGHRAGRATCDLA